ncbi:MAG: hypothetical protein VKN33_08900 [Candidatus Sericytochromatia bacterium]|nr:hypothetical protein [Candidatus Sericytochromatia bacterium]
MPAGSLELSQWHGQWGSMMALTVLGEVNAPGRDAPFYSAGTSLLDLLARIAVDAPGFHILAGYRGIPWSSHHYASVGLSVWRPLPLSFLRMELRGIGGHNLGLENRWRSFIDATAGLTAQRDSFALTLGLRHLAAMSAVEPTFVVSGPFGSLRFEF